MPHLSKSDSARANGAKSHGPKTEAGRARSSQNALKHGFSAQTIVLPSEDPAEFQQLLASYLDDFHPSSPVELDLVHHMVAAQWRLRRLATIETQLIDQAIEHIQEYSDDPPTPERALAEGFERLANGNSFAFLHRTESRLERTYSRALRNLLQLQKIRQCSAPTPGCSVATHGDTPPESKTCKNEPNQNPAPLNFQRDVINDRANAPVDPAMPRTRQANYLSEDSGASRIPTGAILNHILDSGIGSM